MNIKQTIIALLLVLGVSATAIIPMAPVAEAAECGGVQTALINCDQTGSCEDGSSPRTGTSEDEEKAQNLREGRCADGSYPSDNIERTGFWGILLLAITIMTAGVGILAVGGIVYGSILYVTAGGSSEQVKKAVGIITNVAIGILAYGLMFALLNFLIPGGLFSDSPSGGGGNSTSNESAPPSQQRAPRTDQREFN